MPGASCLRGREGRDGNGTGYEPLPPSQRLRGYFSSSALSETSARSHPRPMTW
jgi:hypothetical protein